MTRVGLHYGCRLLDLLGLSKDLPAVLRRLRLRVHLRLELRNDLPWNPMRFPDLRPLLSRPVVV